MCGIIGYIGKKQSVPILIKGLSRLEYRGYDSAGFVILEEKDLKTVKEVGKIKELKKKISKDKFDSHIGIAHTRWATHGQPSEVNAHPHSDCHNEISIVHNGIIENYRLLKSQLLKKGHRFLSETDSEIIAHLIEEMPGETLLKKVQLAVKKLKGAYGILVISKNHPDEIIVVRNGSPILLGLGKNENFVASDAAALLGYTKKVIYLEDRQIVQLKADSYQIIDFSEKVVKSKINEIDWDLGEIEKGGYNHFMIKEIHEQAQSIRDTIAGRVREDQVKLGGIKNRFQELLDTENIILSACGTSWHACLIGEIFFETLAGKAAEVTYASELVSAVKPKFPPKSTMVVISQSGETKDTDLAIQKMQAENMSVFGICNVVGSTIARRCGAGIYTHAGPEIGVASTKAFSTQIMALLMMAFNIGDKNGFINQNFGAEWKKDFLKEIIRIPFKVEEILKTEEKIKDLAKILYQKHNFLFLGRGINFPVALEGALKLKEISYIHAEGYPAAEMKHGPIALIDENMPVVFIAPKNDAVYSKICSNIEEVRARKGIVIVIASEGDEYIQKIADHIIYVPETFWLLTPILNTIPLQLLAYHIAVLKGCNVDQPRNLAKSVTVE
jgi:glutamine---fructose-6-phosphate transaminase (isomerizing)